MAEVGYREYLINTNEVGEVRKDILERLNTKLAERTAVLLRISATIDGSPTTRNVAFLPTRVEYTDNFLSWGIIEGDDTEASIKSEAEEMYLVMDAALDHPTDDSEQLTTS